MIKPELFLRCRDYLKCASTERHNFFVPGRLEFLGKHTDYCGGRSLICAIEQGIGLIAAPRSDGVLRLTDANSGEFCEFSIRADLEPVIGHWTNYPTTVARRVARNFAGPFRGADIAFASDLPPAAGLSSSSALIVAFFLALDAVNQLRDRPEHRDNIRSNEDLAGYLATIENGQSFGSLQGDRGVGTFGGSQDHTAILCAKAGCLSQYSFCPVRHERDVPVRSEYVLAIGVSGVVAEKTGVARQLYNRVSQLVAEMVVLWRDKTRRTDATLAEAIRSSPDAIDRLRQLLKVSAPYALDRFEQFVLENHQFIPAAGDALLRADWITLGKRVDESQQAAERGLKNQTPETISLARQARQLGAAAASAFGAGFGGSVWALIPRTSSSQFLERWRREYLSVFPLRADQARFFLTTAGPAASVLKD